MVAKKEEGRGKKEEGLVRSARGYRKLIAWQKAQVLASRVFAATKRRRLPYWQLDQVMKSVTSVHANIAEGYTRGTLRDYIHFLDMARASLAEVESHLYFMVENELMAREAYDEVDELSFEVGNIIVGLMRSLNAKLKDGSWSRLAEEGFDYLAQSSVDPLLPPSSFLLPDGGEV